MKEITVLSGKGGTGKTSFVAAFAALATEHMVLGDCDVDAANLALLLPGKDTFAEPFFAGRRARFSEERCAGCGECVAVCRFEALEMSPSCVPVVEDLSCEGCGACALICPEDAVRFVKNRSGTLYQRETRGGPLVHAALGVAEDNSGKLVTRVRERARTLADGMNIDLVMYDGPPGIGCPVHAALGGVNLVVAVTEPTPSGLHDLARLLELTAHFHIETVVVVNKFDLNPSFAEALQTTAKQKGGRLIGRVPFDANVPRALAEGSSPLAVPAVREALQHIWREVCASLAKQGGGGKGGT